MDEYAQQSLVAGLGPRDRTIRLDDGQVVAVPKSWTLLPPGDAGLTRKVKATGPTWTVKEKRGRRVFSRGVWADGKQIAAARRDVDQTRSTDAYAKRQRAAKVRRDNKQAAYVDEFFAAVVTYLNFAPQHGGLARRLAIAVVAHATPVGSGTVARTRRIPINRRAEAAVIAWMRHQTTGYDEMSIAKVKGQRRDVRRQLATESKRLLARYRGSAGRPTTAGICPLVTALEQLDRDP